MKYLFFSAAIIAIVPATVFLLAQRSLLKWAVLMLFLPLLFFDGTAINFFSDEFYRGTSRGMEISIIYIDAFIIVLTLNLYRGKLPVFPDWGSRIYLLYFLCSLPSLMNADNRLYCFFELWKMIMIHIVFLAVYYYLELTKGDFDTLIKGLIIVVTANFLVVVYQHLIGFYQVFGRFPHQNSLAMYMTIAGTLLFSHYFNRSDKRRTICFLAFGMASVTLIRTYSRGAIACYPVGALLTLLASMRYRFSARKIYLTLLLGLVGIACLLVFLPRIIERFEKAPESSGQTRKDFAIAAINMMKDVPFAGVGINNWGIKINPPYEYSRHREEKHFKEDYKDGIVETIYLLVGAECGIPCLAVLLIWFAYYWFSAIRLLRRLRRTPYFYIPAGALGGLTGVFLQSTLEWVLKQQMNFMLLVIVFAFLSYLNRHYRELTGEVKPPVITATSTMETA